MIKNKNYNKSDRMKELLKSFEEKNEVIKESKVSKISKETLKKESDRLKTIARIEDISEKKEELNEWTSNSQQFASKMPYVAGQGQTVNTFMGNPEAQPQGTQNVVSPDGTKYYNPNYTYLQPAEALRLSIKRTIESGAPVSNLGFYEEVNWTLNNMGFPAKSALDIKNAIAKMIRD